MKGREWTAGEADRPSRRRAHVTIAAGYQAYVIDRAGYEDHGARSTG
jgi:hypothetical protein